MGGVHMEIRKYQQELIVKALNTLHDAQSVMVVLCTGAGKTHVAVEIAKHFKKVMWAAHRIELLQQADQRLRGAHPNYRLQSVWVPPDDQEYDLLVLDETHHAPAPTLHEFISRSKCTKILGLTATPFRLDRKFIGFEKIVEGAKFEDLVTAGFLTPIDLYSVRGVDRYASIVEWLINNPEKAAGTIVFTPNIADAVLFVRDLGLAYRISVVHGKQPAEERAAAIKAFTDGEIDILASCMLLTEGVDIPRAQTICLARQTDSVSLLMQMIGRGVRPFNSKKVCNVIEAISPSDRRQSIVNIISPNNHYIVSADGRTEKM
jgi:superfamily II DNA or RNA helicase